MIIAVMTVSGSTMAPTPLIQVLAAIVAMTFPAISLPRPTTLWLVIMDAAFFFTSERWFLYPLDSRLLLSCG